MIEVERLLFDAHRMHLVVVHEIAIVDIEIARVSLHRCGLCCHYVNARATTVDGEFAMTSQDFTTNDLPSQELR